MSISGSGFTPDHGTAPDPGSFEGKAARYPGFTLTDGPDPLSELAASWRRLAGDLAAQAEAELDEGRNGAALSLAGRAEQLRQCATALDAARHG